MAYDFDTGLALPQRTLIRRGVVQLLSGLAKPTGYLQAVVPFGGIVRSFTDDHGIDQLWQAFKGRAPSIAIALGDRITHPAGMGGFKGVAELELLVYCFSSHRRDPELGRLEPDAAAIASNAADPGLDVVMEHVEELLVGQRVGAAPVTSPVGEVKRATPSIKQIQFGREEELRTEAGFTLWLQRYSVTVTRSIDKYRNVSQLLEEIRTKVRTSDDASADPAAPVTEQQNLVPTPA